MYEDNTNQKDDFDKDDFDSDLEIGRIKSDLKLAQHNKRFTNAQKDKPNRALYLEGLPTCKASEKPTKMDKRNAYNQARAQDFKFIISRRKAERIAGEPGASCRQIKMRKAIRFTISCRKAERIAYKSRTSHRHEELRQKEEFNADADLDISDNESARSTTKAKSQQANAPEVIIDKRLQDAHRQFRAPKTVRLKAPLKMLSNKRLQEMRKR